MIFNDKNKTKNTSQSIHTRTCVLLLLLLQRFELFTCTAEAATPPPPPPFPRVLLSFSKGSAIAPPFAARDLSLLIDDEPRNAEPPLPPPTTPTAATAPAPRVATPLSSGLVFTASRGCRRCARPPLATATVDDPPEATPPATALLPLLVPVPLPASLLAPLLLVAVSVDPPPTLSPSPLLLRLGVFEEALLPPVIPVPLPDETGLAAGFQLRMWEISVPK